MSSKYLLHVVKSKAINSADIGVDSISVLSGVNASGKSTLARMLHEIVNLDSIYPILLKRHAWASVRDWARCIVQLNDRLQNKGQGVMSVSRVSAVSIDFESRLKAEDFQTVIDDLDTFSRKVLDLYRQNTSQGDAKRAFLAFARAVGVGDDLIPDIDKVLEIFENKKRKCLDVLSALGANRNYEVYNYVTDLKYDISWLVDADEVSFCEDGEPVYAVHRSDAGPLIPTHRLKEMYGLRHSFYIASPWVGIPQPTNDGGITIRYDDFPHYPVTTPPTSDNDLFKVLGGTVGIDESTGKKKWVYNSPALSKPIDLMDCATGIKSIAILNILYKGGYLNEETLLIIDEPEAHLHPQWIFEYALILVRLAIRLKVRLLLTSHSPDMISAIKVISEAEGLKGVCFYVANKIESHGGLQRYDYECLNMNIEKIFKKFNVALDNIDTYSSAKHTNLYSDDIEQ